MSKKNKGFTLLEFVIIIVLFGIVGACVVPNMDLVDISRSNSVAKQLVYDLKSQRQRAMTGAPHADGYGIELLTSDEGNNYGYNMPPEKVDGARLTTEYTREDMSKKVDIELQAYTSTLGVKQPVSIYFDRYGHMYMKPSSAAGLTEDTPVTILWCNITYNGQQVSFSLDGKTGYDYSIIWR